MLDLIINLLILIISLIVLGTSAKYVVEKSEKLSHFFGMNRMAFGFIFLAVMTSLPELSVAIVSSSTGENNLSLGNLLGSNVTNIALILGICIFIGLKITKKKTPSLVLMIILSLLPIILIFDGNLTYVDGLLLLLFFAIFCYIVIKEGMIVNNMIANDKKRVKIEKFSKVEAAKDFFIFVAAIIIVIVSAGFVVESAVKLAEVTGIFKMLIGATIIALGTSLPELAVDITAVKKGKGDLALGDILGSCVTNLTLVLGVNVLLSPFVPNMKIVSSLILFVIVVYASLIYLLLKGFNKKHGLLFLLIYIIYVFWLVSLQLV